MVELFRTVSRLGMGEYGVEMLTKQQVDIAALVGSTLPLSQADRLPALLSERGGLKRKIVLDCSA